MSECSSYSYFEFLSIVQGIGRSEAEQPDRILGYFQQQVSQDAVDA